MKQTKLPKQWKHWCAQNNLRPCWVRHWGYLRGQGYLWRVNCKNMLQCGDSYEDFDRWALCDIVEAQCPQSLKDFTATVKTLLELKLASKQTPKHM